MKKTEKINRSRYTLKEILSNEWDVSSIPDYSDSEIEKMKEDAKAHEKEDKEKRKLIDVHNNAEQLIYQTEKQISDLGDKLDDKDKEDLQKSIDSLKEVNKSSDIEMIEKAINDLNSTWQGLSEKMYQQSKDTEGAQNPEANQEEVSGSKKDKDSEVEEADFEEVK